MAELTNDLYTHEYFDYLQKRGTLRRLVRKAYLHDIRKYCIGKTIDFGCGIGELLRILPASSIGLEINPEAVSYCKSNGLLVDLYLPELDDYGFSKIETGIYRSFTMNHVLEHIENSAEVIQKIFKSCIRLGIRRIVFTVPGFKGFQSDRTHRTFIDMKYFKERGLLDNENYKLRVSKYFPINNEKFSHFFTHNELRIVFDKRND